MWCLKHKGLSDGKVASAAKKEYFSQYISNKAS